MRAFILALLVLPARGFCWGDAGHEVVGLIAEHFLEPAVRPKVAALLAGDTSGLTHNTGIAAEAAWADKFRDSDRNTTQLHYHRTQAWHFIDIEIDAPDVAAACFRYPTLEPGSAASEGPAADCILDKINEFRQELHNTATPAGERRVALQFLLHLVGDVHQPLHAADNHDRGGNGVQVRAVGYPRGNLHHYWDTVFVERLGRDPELVARQLIAGISPKMRRSWSRGAPLDWAGQSFEIGKIYAYGALPRVDPGNGSAADPRGELFLDAAYVAKADTIVAMQLQRAGLRLARLLNLALRQPRPEAVKQGHMFKTILPI